MEPIEIWTDGACKGNPGPGGWGARLVFGVHERNLYGGDPQTTNNRMELLAVIAALSMLKKKYPLVIHLDSQYVKNGIESWIAGWKRNGWKTSARKPVKNAGLWMALSELVDQYDISWRWVKGHAGDPGNEQADLLANWGAEEARGERAPCPELDPKVREKLEKLLKECGA